MRLNVFMLSGVVYIVLFLVCIVSCGVCCVVSYCVCEVWCGARFNVPNSVCVGNCTYIT